MVAKVKSSEVKKVVRKRNAPKDVLYFLRTCAKDGTSYKGKFKWNLEIGAKNTCPDWNPEPVCGGGLHGLLGGCGESGHLDWGDDALWVVFSSPSSVDLNGKHKVQEATICAIGDRKTATDFLVAKGFQGVHGAFYFGGNCATMTGGDDATMTGGYRATMTGGNYATMTGGNYATMTGGNSAKMTGGNFAKMTGGNGATMTGGYYANMTGGNNANMTGGNFAKMTGGNFANMTGGYRATMTGGNGATMTGGNGATMTGGRYAKMTGGDNAMLVFQYWDGRWRNVTVYVGENGIEPNVAYKLNDKHQVVKA